MDLIYLLGLIVLLFSIIFVVTLVVADCDIVTFLCSIFGKQPSEYKGKVVWITGASSGIGEGIAKQLAKAGARLILSARRQEELERVKRECLNGSSLTEKDILVLSVDLTNLESHEPALKNILKHFGKLDVLLSNAGQSQQDEFVNLDMLIDKHIFDINVFSVVNMNRVVVNYFLKNGGGQVAVVSSLNGRIAVPLGSAYAASKHAIHGYFNTLRIETCGYNVSVTLVCPGLVDTPIFTKAVTKEPEKANNITKPLGLPIMSVERCAYLTLISMANRLNESWISKLPTIPMAYLENYCPIIYHIIYKRVGWKMFVNFKQHVAGGKKC
ncbi:unnamed protein product [Allacma fusca]|uniref:Dehydrogenase/reductase SDR family member 7 n=1 Tax=Allacma fusca TaxID=39272 RepID=A0A8J2L117_9HEXA|nr:unnamed protein product [Allacma fusca]